MQVVNAISDSQNPGSGTPVAWPRPSRAPVAFSYGLACPNAPASSSAPASPLLCATRVMDSEYPGGNASLPLLGSLVVARGAGEPPHPTPKTRNPEPETRNPKPETRNPKPETRNPKPETPNPKP
jgi:hypothetical protein